MDLAILGIKVDATSTDTAKAKLDALAATGAKTETATRQLETATSKLSGELKSSGGVVAMYEAQIAKAKASLAASVAETERLNNVTKNLASGTRSTASELVNLAEGAGNVETKIISVSTAGKILEETLKSMGLQIGITGAAADGLYASLAGLAGDLVGPLGALADVAVVVGASFAIATEKQIREVGSVTDSLNLTTKQLENTWRAGTSDFITYGDSWNGLITTVKDSLAQAFAPQIAYVHEKMSELFEFVIKSGTTAAYNLAGGFTGAYTAIVTTWRQFPGAVGDAVITGVNQSITAIEGMINKAIGLINKFAASANAITSKVGITVGQIGNVSAGRVDNPYAGQRASFNANASAAFKAGDASGRAGLKGFNDRWEANSRNAAEDRILGDAGYDDEKAKKGTKPKTAKHDTSFTDYLEASVKRANEAFAKLNEATEASEKKATVSAEKIVANLKLQADLRGMDAQQRAVAIAANDLEEKGILKTTAAYHVYGEQILAAASATGALAKASDDADNVVKHMNDVRDSVKDATASFSELFGTAGKGFADLIDGITNYAVNNAQALKDMSNAKRDYADDSVGYSREMDRIAKKQANDELNSYGSIIHGVKGLFKEKSAGYKAMEAVEKAYSVIRLAMLVRELLTEGIVTTAKVSGASARIAADTTETASTVANSSVKATAHGIVAFAHTLADLPFPLNLVAGAAVIAALVGVGVAISGGGGGGKGAKASDTVDKAPVRPTDYSGSDSPYSVGRTGTEGIVNSPSNAKSSTASVGKSTGDVNITNHYQINADGANSETVAQMRDMLHEHTEQTVKIARQAVAQDNATQAKRQNLGGVG